MLGGADGDISLSYTDEFAAANSIVRRHGGCYGRLGGLQGRLSGLQGRLGDAASRRVAQGDNAACAVGETATSYIES